MATKHIHKYGQSFGTLSTYDVDIFQCAYDEICICLDNTGYINCPSGVQFDIPIKKKAGFSIKVNKASVSNDSGKASDLIDFLSTETGGAFINGMIKKLIFENEKKRATPGL